MGYTMEQFDSNRQVLVLFDARFYRPFRRAIDQDFTVNCGLEDVPESSLSESNRPEERVIEAIPNDLPLAVAVGT